MKKVTDTRIWVRDISHLIELCDSGIIEFAMCLNGGVISRKDIMWGGRKFHVFNGIDGSMDKYTPEEMEWSFINSAIMAKAFYAEA